MKSEDLIRNTQNEISRPPLAYVWVCVCMCVGIVMCGRERARARVCVCVCKFCNEWVFWQYVYCTLAVFLTLTEVFPCFFLSCKANARIKLAKTGHGPHFSKLVVIWVVSLLLVLFYALFVYKCVLYYCHRLTTQLQLTNIS
jgi:cytochrome bd-type quinol oxidase subunit 2